MRRKNTTIGVKSVDISSAERVIFSTLHLMLAAEIREIRVRIRATRLALGWSLAEFEIHSEGAITAIAMGSYERGTRSLSIAKLLTICNIFKLPLIHILAPAKELNTGESASRHIYDLRALQGLPNSSEKAHLLSYIKHIIRERGDWKGAVVSLRTTDVQNLELIFATSQEVESHDYQAWLAVQGISLNKTRGISSI
jgi:transcriptional regulator with XRE-family HTH domain